MDNTIKVLITGCNGETAEALRQLIHESTDMEIMQPDIIVDFSKLKGTIQVLKNVSNLNKIPTIVAAPDVKSNADWNRILSNAGSTPLSVHDNMSAEDIVKVAKKMVKHQKE